MSEEPLRQDADFDRDFWREYASRDLQEARATTTAAQ
jgi:hypothetical protein